MRAVNRLLPLLVSAACTCLAGGPFCVAPDYASPLKPLPHPEVHNRTLVILGSSTAEGIGASSLATSWAGRLASQLARSGIRVENRSRAGTNTRDSLDRFDRDVTPLQPGIVILATSIVNESFAAEPQAAYERYVTNTKALIGRVRDIGAVPVNITMYPYVRNGVAHLALIEDLTSGLEEWGWPLLNFWSPVAVESGSWIPLLSADGLHPLDAGHQALFDAIPDSLFSRILEPEPPPAEPETAASLRAGEGADGETSLRITPARELSSWTVAAHLRDPAAGEESRIFSVAGSLPVRLWRRSNRLELWAGDELLAVRAEPSAGWHHFALSYQFLTGRLVFAVDGLIWGEVQAAPRMITNAVEVAASCPACRVANVTLYRTNLLCGELARLATQSALRRSLEGWLPPLRELPPGGNLNMAETAARIEARGDWTAELKDSVPRCETPSSGRPIDRGGKQ